MKRGARQLVGHLATWVGVALAVASLVWTTLAEGLTATPTSDQRLLALTGLVFLVAGMIVTPPRAT